MSGNRANPSSRARVLGLALLSLALLPALLSAPAQRAVAQAALPPSATFTAKAQKGQTVLQAMVTALGGQRWLRQRDFYSDGTVSGFFHGTPDGSLLRFYSWRVPLGPERVEMTKQKNVVELYDDPLCTEITYRGAYPQQKDICDQYWRLRHHSLVTAILGWLPNPQTMVFYDGQVLSERHLADKVTLLNAQDDAITIEADADTHLPLQVSFTYRDPQFGDKDTEVIEYSNYHLVDGVETPFTVTDLHNGEMVEQRFLFGAAYNVPLPPAGFSAAATLKAARSRD